MSKDQCASPELVRLVTVEANRVASQMAGYDVSIYNDSDVQAVLNTFISLRNRKAPFTTDDVEHYSTRNGRIVAAALSAFATITSNGQAQPTPTSAGQPTSWVKAQEDTAANTGSVTSYWNRGGVRLGLGAGLFAVIIFGVYKLLPK